ncbi:MAG: arginine--tRNA ligase [Clostridiales bacterium]|nr:arginine--tRNA ligase [Clostridiales bacterium]
MINYVKNLREEIVGLIKKALEKSIRTEEFENFELGDDEFVVEIPKEKTNGDFSTNIAMKMAKKARKAPRVCADIIIRNMEIEGSNVDRVECAGAGFINFYLKMDWLYDVLRIIQKEGCNYGKSNIGNGKKIMVEFVSANPTGPLHMGNARGGALGDLIAGVFEATGHEVVREFYINDAGNQIEKFGVSLEARYIQQIKGEDAISFPEDGYHGEDLIEHVKAYIEEYGDSLINVSEKERRKTLVDYALPRNINMIKEGLARYGITYDVWFSEKTLHDSGEIKKVVKTLDDTGYCVDKDGAKWFKSPMLGDDKEAVLVRNNGVVTYFAADIAYHKNKFVDRGFDRVINLWGADHHGHVARMKAGIAALGIDPDRLDIVLFQLVHLYQNGEKVRMSKRTGKAISLIDLLDEVGKDAARFIFNTRASGNHLDFDLDLAVKKSNDNPVYYVQYAYARICSILRVCKEEGIVRVDLDKVDLSQLKNVEEIELIRALARYPEEIEISLKTLEPSRLTRYVLDVAGLFHSFYNSCRIKDEEDTVRQARLVLVESVKIVIKNVLDLLKISAPEKM